MSFPAHQPLLIKILSFKQTFLFAFGFIQFQFLEVSSLIKTNTVIYIHLSQINKQLLYQAIKISNSNIFIQMSIYPKISTLIIVVVLFSQEATSSSSCGQYVYDYNLLVFDWPNEYCYHRNSCKPNWKDLVKANQFIIRGFWPASKDLNFLNCIKSMGNDPKCYVAYNYSDNYLTASVKSQLSLYWPQINISNDLKQDQWYEHGTCYVSILQTLNKTLIGKQQTIFESYFKDSVIRAKKLKLNITQQQFKTKADLGASLGISQKQFFALCQYDNDYLSQIRVCYDIKPYPGSQNTVNCLGQEPNQCQFPVKIRTKSQTFLQCFFVLILSVFILLQ